MDVAETHTPPADLVMDPFAYVPDMASKIGGLGGNTREPEGDYAFHTVYAEVAEGVAHFAVQFDRLSATQGTLNLRVHMLTPDSPHARLAAADRVALNRLILGGGHYQIRFEAYHGAKYALYGGVIGDTDATAQAVRITLDRPALEDAHRIVAAEARNTVYGTQAVAVPHLVSLSAPTLTAPVTQFATTQQLKGNAAARWLESGGNEELDELGRWRATYVVQALRTYGMIAPGARGAGMGVLDPSVIAAIAGQDLAIDLIAPLESASADDWYGADPASQCNVSVRPASLVPLSSDLVNYDFIWTRWTAGQVSVRDQSRFIEEAMACLRPGGLAVHVVDYDPDVIGSGVAFTRNDVERIVLLLISRGHDLAEFRVDSTGLLVDRRGLSACGIICRKAQLRD